MHLQSNATAFVTINTLALGFAHPTQANTAYVAFKASRGHATTKKQRETRIYDILAILNYYLYTQQH